MPNHASSLSFVARLKCCGARGVELKGLEPLPRTAKMQSELRFRSASFRFGPARYPRLCLRVLTASRAVDTTLRHRPYGPRAAQDI